MNPDYSRLLKNALEIGIESGFIIDTVVDMLYYSPTEISYVHEVWKYSENLDEKLEVFRRAVGNRPGGHCHIKVNGMLLSSQIYSKEDFYRSVSAQESKDLMLTQSLELILLTGLLSDRYTQE